MKIWAWHTEIIAKTIFHRFPKANSPITLWSQLKTNKGKTANGNWTDCCTFNHSSTLSKLLCAINATVNAGPNAIDLVNNVLFHGAQCISRKPYHTQI